MVEVREIDADAWRAMRDVRLEALRDAPYAFASTYEREVGLAEADWRRRITEGCTFLAHAPGLGTRPAGIACGFEAGPGTVELVSLWVRPRARGHRVGEALVAAVVGWAWAKGVARVHLWVTETNDHARALYERCGFLPTAQWQPLPSDPALTEMGMVRCRDG